MGDKKDHEAMRGKLRELQRGLPSLSEDEIVEIVLEARKEAEHDPTRTPAKSRMNKLFTPPIERQCSTDEEIERIRSVIRATIERMEADDFPVPVELRALLGDGDELRWPRKVS